MFETCQNFTLKNKNDSDSDSDSDQAKTAAKDYVNVKPTWPVCVCVATMLQ